MNRYYLLLLALLLGQTVSATHLLGGYISTKSLPEGANYQQITVYLILDETTGSAASAELNTVLVCFGDGLSGTATRIDRTLSVPNPGTSLNTYRVNHVYPGLSRYALTASLVNRNANLVNLAGSASTPLGLRTTILIGGASNSTPVMPLLSKNFRPNVNQSFSGYYDAGDAEGDSLAYTLAVPLGGSPGCAEAIGAVPNFLFPHAVQQRGTFKLNARTGELVWNAPTALGPHVFAMVIEEWRNGQLISQTHMEQTLTVRDAGGVPVVVPPYEPATLIPQDFVTGLSDFEADLQLSVYPNPVTDFLLVSVANRQAGPMRLQLSDVTGRAVRTDTMTTASHALDVHTLPSGVYILILKTDTGQAVRKVVRQ